MHWKSILETRENLERCDNPDIRMFGYNENSLRIQRSVSIQSGNTREEKTNAGHGKMYLMTLFQKEAKSYIELVVNLNTCK